MEILLTKPIGIGPVSIGMNRGVIRERLGVPWRTIPQQPYSDSEVDYFVSAGIQVEFDSDGFCESITALIDAAPQLHGTPLVGIPFSTAQQRLSELDPMVEVDDSGVTSKALGIAVYAPGSAKNAFDLVESVMLFRDGYYG